jgi:DNA-binding GntR family transcriptional regulator
MIRSFLESLAIQRAVVNITEKDEAELAAIIDRMAEAAENDDIAELTINDGLFHDKICEISGYYLLKQLLSIISGKSRLAIATADRFYAHNLVEIVDIHRPILEGLKNRDAEMTIEANNTHLQCILEQVGKELITEISGLKSEMPE